MKKISFYNNYHRKNSDYHEIIGDNNATYHYILKAISKGIDQLPKKKARVLDVGCGVGTLAFYLAKKGHSVDAIDVSTDAISICNRYKVISKFKNIKFVQGDLEDIKLKGRYDFILCTEVIEHIRHDGRFILRLYEKCAKDGVLLISTPSLNAPLFRIGMLKKFDSEVGHLRRYTSEGLKKKIESKGFTVTNIMLVESVLRNSLYTLPYLGFLVKFIRGPMVVFFHLIDLVLVKLLGESDIIILAKKK